MPNPMKVFENRLNASNFNLLMFINFFGSLVGSMFLAWNGVTAGIIYTLMFLAGIAVLSLIMLFLKDDDGLKPITNFTRIPLATKFSLAAGFYLIGVILPFIVNAILRAGTSFSITSFSVPLFGADIITGGQTFATAVIGESMPWKIYNIMFVAGNMETLIYNFILVLVGVLIGWFILSKINDGKDFAFMSRKTFVLMVAFIFSTALFVVSHVMNRSYGTGEFIVAAIFLLIANTSIYLSGVFLTFWAGFHQSNNLIFLIQQEGLPAVLNGFISWFGFLYILYLAVILVYVIRNFSVIVRDITGWSRS